MSATCNRCYRIVDRACQSDTETEDCRHLREAQAADRFEKRRARVRAEWESKAKAATAEGRAIRSMLMIVNTDELETLKSGIWDVWNDIGPDAEPVCDGDNKSAVEMCIDCDRLAEKDDAAYAVWRKLRDRKPHETYAKLLTKVSALISLV